MMQITQRNICCVLYFQISFLMYIEGLSLYPASDLTLQNFTLVCDLQETPWTNTILFSYDGSPGGGCGSPPTPTCVSSIGVITPGTRTVHLTLNQNEILSKGNSLWTCNHGTVPANYNATVIALCTNIEVKYADEKMDISCSCGFPSVQAELEYKDSQNGDTLRSQTFDLSSSPGTNCTTDIRAKDYSSKIANFPSGTVEVCATVRTYSQTTTPTTICALVPDCSLDIFLYGFLPVFLIVLIVSIAIIIILKIERLPKQFGELAWKKLVIIAICFVVAIIIGVCLGLLIKGCDNKYLALGLSLLFGILIVVALIFALIYYHKKCESRREIQDGSDGGAQDGNGLSLDSCFRKCKVKPEKEMKSPKKTGSTTNKNTREKTGESKNNTGSNTTKNATERGGDSQNNTGSNATKTATERVGSPASTSNIELAAKNKAGVPKGEQSALKQKEINTPLPQPPSGNSQYLTASTNNLPVPRNNHLDPIVMENEEANPSERKKKKRKKKKRKNEKNADEAGDNEDEN